MKRLYLHTPPKYVETVINPDPTNQYHNELEAFKQTNPINLENAPIFRFFMKKRNARITGQPLAVRFYD